MLRTSLAGLVLAGLAFAAAAQTRWDLPTGYPAGNFHTENIVQFVGDVEKATGGKLKITVHPAASLFKAPEIKRAVQGGQAQAGEILLANFQNEWQPFGVDSIPFLADSYAASRKLYQAQKPVLEKKLAEQGMTLLFSVAWPPQGIYSGKPINAAADLKGAKWRAYSPATSRVAELVGAQPVTVQAAELSQALATGVVDTFMTSSSSGYDAKVYEQMKYYYTVEAWLPRNAVVASRKAMDELDPATRTALLQAAAAAEDRGWKLSQQKDKEYLALLAKGGMTIAEPSPQLKADMRKVGATMLQEWLQKAGAEGQTIIDAYRKP